VCQEKNLPSFPEIDPYFLSRPTVIQVSLRKRILKFRLFRDDDDDDDINDNDSDKRTCQCVLRFRVLLIVFRI
jgi:hypothetical protein